MRWLSDLLPLIVLACCIAVVLLGRARGKAMYAATLRDVRAEGHAEGRAGAVAELQASMGVTVVAGNTVQGAAVESGVPHAGLLSVPAGSPHNGRVLPPDAAGLPHLASAPVVGEDGLRPVLPAAEALVQNLTERQVATEAQAAWDRILTNPEQYDDADERFVGSD